MIDHFTTNMMELDARRTSIDTSKPVKTRGGMPARILCADLKIGMDLHPYERRDCGTVVAAVLCSDGQETVAFYTFDGSHCYCVDEGKVSFAYTKSLDLVNVPDDAEAAE
jgi:hypothetical protein